MSKSARFSALLLLLTLLPPGGHSLRANAPNLNQFQHRSVSSSRQFVVYCPDVKLRLAIAGYVDTVKATVLKTLGVGDRWKIPIVVTLIPPETTRPAMPLSDLKLVVTDEGPKIDIALALREERFREVHFPQLVIRAVLLEIAYRDQEIGDHLYEPPGWLIEAIADQLQSRIAGSGPNATMFKTMISTGRLPPLREFLDGNVARMDSTSRAIFGECSASLLEMLTALPGGRRSLLRAVQNLHKSKGDPIALLLENFSALGNSEASLERWWTLGLARYSALDRYLTLTVEETNSRLIPLLQFEVVTDAETDEKTLFHLDHYADFAKLRSARVALVERSTALTALHLRAHPLMRPVIAEYQRIVRLLAEGKGRNFDRDLADIGNYRSMIVERSDRITDYLNWYEATQMSESSGAFDSYLRTANTLENAPLRKRDDALSRYVDQVELEFQ